jgi:hypothetical protein
LIVFYVIQIFRCTNKQAEMKNTISHTNRIVRLNLKECRSEVSSIYQLL